MFMTIYPAIGDTYRIELPADVTKRIEQETNRLAVESICDEFIDRTLNRVLVDHYEIDMPDSNQHKVQIGVYWEEYGNIDVDIPDDVDINDMDAIRRYIDDNWDDIPLPRSGNYVSDSAQFDGNSIIIIE